MPQDQVVGLGPPMLGSDPQLTGQRRGEGAGRVVLLPTEPVQGPGGAVVRRQTLRGPGSSPAPPTPSVGAPHWKAPYGS